MSEKCRQFCLGLNVLILSELEVAVLAVQFIGLRGYKRALRVILSILVKNNKVSLITGLFYNILFKLCYKLLQPVTTILTHGLAEIPSHCSDNKIIL